MDYSKKISEQLNLRVSQIAPAIELLDGGNTIPFIARYRKEKTGTLDEEQLRQISALLERLRSLDNRRETVLASIGEQGKLTDELKNKIMGVETLTDLEDLYLPFKPKRRTRASIAREKGLQDLAEMIIQQAHSKVKPEITAKSFLNDKVPSIEEALDGARDIVAEIISDHAEIRWTIREKALKWGMLHCEKIHTGEDEKGIFETYYDFHIQVDRIRPHQVLAVNRGETEKILRIKLEVSERDWLSVINTYYHPDHLSPFREQLTMAINDAGERLLLPAIERDVRRILTEKAEAHAISVFSNNLRALLSQPPLTGYTVMGIDPGYRTGCKVAVVDPTGKVLVTGTIYPHEPQNKKKEALEILAKIVDTYSVTLISIGNGTASRETEQLVAELVQEKDGLKYLITSESGASVYSASPLARSELPDLDVSLRGAVSIARRIQDPLGEFVKIDSKSIGIGLYQHDVNQADLGRSLNNVVESVVNQVGVNLNTASPALLTYISGIGQKLAERIVAYRDENGEFRNRVQLKKVSGLGPKAFEQSAGFLRIPGGDNPLDGSAIHPESYSVAEAIIKLGGVKLTSQPRERRARLEALLVTHPLDEMAKDLYVGIPTLTDILEQLERPGRDPREDLPVPILRSDVLSMDDLVSGMKLKGTVRNVVDFGAFVDIGVKNDGLLHRTQIPQGTLLQVGDIIDVTVIKVEKERGRISLSWAGN